MNIRKVNRIVVNYLKFYDGMYRLTSEINEKLYNIIDSIVEGDMHGDYNYGT